ncbi:ImmA/IrrE family metallo-endopeptidase [Fructobacillus americanaquae]|uniref:ImmA/IrrE family metallo-endopeptidase n=1 Tax=Fructobacillus americanaquae TaxID=2940302 RepID=A0ABY5C1N0_9LACO|nr:ImmA/IrrE family metallo-endopeptidase [Fructobacillus americanaquae]USS91994.1 ImmA/IrrE family metallo-endopeptidase [Fructobacillus americanaquae]
MEEIIYSLEKIAKQNTITIVDVDSLDDDDSDTSMPDNKIVFMNPAYKKSSYAFRLAHELSHIMYGNNLPNAVYRFSPYFQRGEEYEMHKHAIDMLMGIKRPTSVQTFMEVYKIPSWLEEYVETEYSQQF